MFRFFSSKFVLRVSRTQNKWLSTKCLEPTKSLQILDEKRLFTVNYLVQKCGLSPEKAVSASRNFKFETSEQPDSVLLFLRNLNFSESQVSKMMKMEPSILTVDPEKNLLAKVRFFRSLGFSPDETAVFLSKEPKILRWDLEGQIIPFVEVLKGIITLDGKLVDCLRRYPRILCLDPKYTVIPNITMFQNLGVDGSHIEFFLYNQPRLFTMKPANLKSTVERVMELGFGSYGGRFMLAVHVRKSMNELTWDSKVKCYQSFGFSKEEIYDAFRRQPWFMSISEDKITKMLDFLGNQMAMDRLVLQKPVIMTMSLEKRIKPRCMVYKVLSEKGLIKSKFSLIIMLDISEKMFCKKFVDCYKEEAPELLEIYKKTLALSKTTVK